MKLFRLLILLSICVDSTAAGITIKSVADNKKSVCFSWICTDPHNTTVAIRIYTFEGKGKVFPSNLVDSLSGAATVWCSTERKGVNIFGMDAKSPEQWGDRSVFTKGEVYTIGVERVYINQRTQKNESERVFFHLFPYRNITSLPEGIREISPIQFSLKMPDSYRTFISSQKKGLTFLFPKRGEPIDGVFEQANAYILKLRYSGYIEVDKKPRRPEPLGNPTQVYTILSALFGSLLLFVSIVMIFALSKSIYYLNFLFGNIGQAKKIFSHIMDTERFFSVILFFICMIVKFDLFSKLVKYFTGLDVALFKSDPAFVTLAYQTMSILRSHSVSNQQVIRNELNMLLGQ